MRASRRIGGISRSALRSRRRPEDALRAWPAIANRIRSAHRLALFLDLDGTLVGFRRRPEQVRLPKQAKLLLERLGRHKSVFVAIVSGRRLCDLQRLVDVEGIRLVGLHGAEESGGARRIGRQSRSDLESMKSNVALSFRGVRNIWIEDKHLSLAVHYRGAKPDAIRSMRQTMLRGFAPFREGLRLLKGEMVWEVLPKELPGKGDAVQKLMRRLPMGTLGIYLGDGATDEPAFAALKRGVTIHLGKTQNTRATYQLKNPAAALRFLGMVEKEIP